MRSADVDAWADLDESLVARRGGAIEGADHGARDDVAARYLRFGALCRGRSARGGGSRRIRHRRCHHHLRAAGGMPADAPRLFAFADLELGDARFFEEFDQFFDFAYVHVMFVTLSV